MNLFYEKHMHIHIQPLYENRNTICDDDEDARIRAMQKEQEINAEPFPDSYDSDSERYASLDTVLKHKKLKDELADLCK